MISEMHSLNKLPVVELALNRIPVAQRSAIIDIIGQSKSSSSQKRALLLRKGLLRSTADELETLADTGKLLFPLGGMLFIPFSR
jgi:hypothetical protein